MRDEHDGQPELAVEVAQQREDGLRGVGVKRAGGLVGEQDARAVGQGAGDGHALLLPAGELTGVDVGLVRQVDQREQLAHARVDLGAAHAGVAQRIGDIVRDGAAVEQVELLEDHADAAAQRVQLLFAGGLLRAALAQKHAASADDDGGAVDGHFAVVGRLQQVDAAHERRFARAGVADDAVDFALVDVKTHVARRAHIAAAQAEGFVEMADVDHDVLPHMHMEAAA